jgi:hypothetical protein
MVYFKREKERKKRKELQEVDVNGFVIVQCCAVRRRGKTKLKTGLLFFLYLYLKVYLNWGL